ncbi:hypothetical protein ABID43_002705 [Methylobacterium goesingense]|uniref:Uncharacterized protein n=2 Tax=Methylobacterium goesingense TaxID=243690 RepID=A0ABV2L5Q5_9HYPH
MTKRTPPFSPQSLFERDCLGWIVEGVGGHEASHADEASGRDVEASGALAEKPTPVAQLAEGALDDPAPF